MKDTAEKKKQVINILLWVFFLPIMATGLIIKTTNLKKIVKIVAIILIWIICISVFAVTTCKSTDDAKINSIKNFSQTFYECRVGETLSFSTEIEPNGIAKDRVQIILSNEAVLTVTYDLIENTGKTTANFSVRAVSSGVCNFQISDAEDTVKSNIITIKVEVASGGAEQTPSKSDSTIIGSSDSSDSSAPSESEDTSRVVYIAPTGKRYHYLKSCAGPNAIETTQNKAEKSGRTGCEKCTN